MRTTLFSAVGAAALLGALAACAQNVGAASETLTGEVISLTCYWNDKGKIGKAGQVCSLATIKWEGNPAGLLTADGKLYQIAGGVTARNNEKLWPVLNHTVSLTGEVSQVEGMPTIAADDVKDIAPPK